MERLDAIVKAARAAGDARSPDQIRADVFMDLLTGEGIAAGGPITDGTLGLAQADPGDPGTSDYSIYDPLRHLMHHGTTNKRPTGPGEIQHQTGRFPTAGQAAWVTARDRTCVAPGCRRPARRCDIDHNLDWVKGGETIHCNLGLLCRAHHLFKHATGSNVEQSPPGMFHWQTPAGLQYRTAPDPPLILGTNQLAGFPKPPDPRQRT